MSLYNSRTLLANLIFILGFLTITNAQIESMQPGSFDDNIDFNIPSLPNSSDEAFEFINPQDQQEKFEQTLNRIMQQQIANQELKDLKNKGIVDKEKYYRQRLKTEMDAISNKLPIVDKDLGSVNTKSEYITIMCRDFAYPDGDTVSIVVDGEVRVRNVVLTKNYQQFIINLMEGVNTVSFVALNQGEYGPNTAAFMIFDELGNVLMSNQWNLATGAKATLYINRDK
ncbi:hypothetical protein [Flavicella sp.]|uniref:hypothetical protein n=1 Tax=Flavicella sp. TaxID=2957742 RepID=UPI0030189788